MVVSFVGATGGNTGSATATSLATSFHGSWAADDIAILFTGFGGNSLTVNSGMTDWTDITGFSNPQTEGSASRAYAWFRRLELADTAPTIGYSGSITGGWVMIIVRGAPTGSSPIGQVGSATGSSTSINIASLTGVLADSMLVTLMHARVPTGTAVPAAFTPDADYTQDAALTHATSRNTGTAQNLRFGGGYRAIASAGNYGGDTFTTDQTSSIISLHVEIVSDVTAITVEITQAVESDTAQVLTADNPQTIVITQVVESDTAQTVTAALGTSITQAVEADTAQDVAVDNPVTVAIDQAIETDTAQTLTVVGGAGGEVFSPNFEISPSRWAAQSLTIIDGDDPVVDLDACIGQQEGSYKFLLVDGITRQVIKELHPSKNSEPSLSHDTTRLIKRTLSGLMLTPEDVAEINPVRHRIALSMTIAGQEFPLGRYVFSDFTRIPTLGGHWASATLLDEMFIVDQPLETSFSVPSQTQITSLPEGVEKTIANLLATVPIDSHIKSTTFLSSGAWPQGTRRGTVLADLALLGDYFSPWFDHNSILRVERIFDPAEKPADFNWDERNFVIRDSITEVNDYLYAPNKIVVVSNDAANSSLNGGAIYGSYNIPASAPHSLVNRGFVIQETVTMQVNSSLQAAAVAFTLGQRTLTSDRVELSTPVDPRHDSYNVIRWDNENWLEVSWTMPLVSGGEMRHVLRKAYEDE